MSSTITRTAWTDDDGSGTTGTVINNAVKTELYNQIDALFNGTAALYLGGAVGWGVYSPTTTGTQNDWDIDTANGNVTVGFLRCNNATALTITGIKAPSAGRLLGVYSVGAGTVTLKHQNASSTTAGDRIITADANDLVLYAGVSMALLTYDGTTARWRVIAQSADTTKPLTATTTTTGTQNDFAPGIASNAAQTTVLRCNNASLLTITGFATGLDGQRLILESIGAGQVDLSHQDAGSSTANRLINFATVGKTSLAAGAGTAEFVYDGTTQRWRLVNHNQGAWITRSFAGGNYTTNGAGGWTVGSATNDAYYLSGRTLAFTPYVQSTTVTAATGTELRITLPAGLTGAKRTAGLANINDNGTYRTGVWDVQAGVTYVRFFSDQTAAVNWTASVTNTIIDAGSIVIEVQ
jgi:hypothetical protein